MLLKKWCCAFIIVVNLAAPIVAKAAQGKKIDDSKPRMVMVEVPSWKTAFFGLPQELPLLIQPGEKFESKSRHYDFTEGMRAMEVYLALRPKSKYAPAYKRFLGKWPLYQKFFKCVEQEDYSEAANLLQQILKIDSEDPAAHFYWGSLNTHLQKYAQAEKNYQTCLQYYPEYGPAYINLARLAKARGADKEAQQYLRQAVGRLKGSGQDDALRIAEKMLETLEK